MCKSRLIDQPSVGQLKRVSIALMGLVLWGLISACGGGGAKIEAVVTQVRAASVLEGGEGTSRIVEFEVELNKPVVDQLTVFYDVWAAPSASLGFAKGGSACGLAEVDFRTLNQAYVVITAGNRTAKLPVRICGDGLLEPHETFNLTWSASGSPGGTVTGLIVNDDAGGLNATGATNLLGGVSAYGRDTIALTNSDTDGRLGFSFDTSKSACVLDQVTGLTWQAMDAWTMSTYAQLSSAVQMAQGLCGLTNWRVPTVNELLTLMDYSRSSTQIVNADGLGSAGRAMTGEFWSNEVVTTASANAWVVSAGQGGAVSFVNQTSTNHLRLVSGSSTLSACSNDPNDSSRYADQGDGTVIDLQTKLMWRRCREGASGPACGVVGASPTASVDTITSHVALVNSYPLAFGLGYADWRVPNVKELASLVDRCTGSNLAINSTFFPNTEAVSYVSATLDANNPQQAWYVDFALGTVAVGSITNVSNKFLRLVRAGH